MLPVVGDGGNGGVPYPDKRAEIEQFIDRVLAVFAGVPCGMYLPW
jgi:hypothetical protein